MFPPISSALFASIEVTKQFDAVLIVAIFRIVMLFKFSISDVPSLWHFHEDGFCEWCLWECLGKIDLAGMEIEDGGEDQR